MNIELCTASKDALDFAVEQKIDRIELCEQLEFGGLTPSLEFVEQACSLFHNTHILIRPRIGDFVYNDLEKESILKHIKQMQHLGINGVVVGALRHDRTLDVPFLEEIRSVCTVELTFHRAFDDLKNYSFAFEQLQTIGFNRVLTSGGQLAAEDGIDLLKQLQKSNIELELMVGGGITEHNVQRILQEVKPDAIHFSGTKAIEKNNSQFFGAKVSVFDTQKARAILDKIRNFTY